MNQETLNLNRRCLNTAHRVLIIDDELGMRRSLTRVLSAHGYDVETAEDGESGIAKAQWFEPDCVIVDVRMPGIGGVEAFRCLNTATPNAFVIIMSAYYSPDVVEQVTKLGAVDYLVKPLNLERIAQLIEDHTRYPDILIIDDDPDFCASLERILVANECRVRIAYNPNDGLAIFEACPRGVVILNTNMIAEGSTQLLRAFRERNHRVECVLISDDPETLPAQCVQGTWEGTPCFVKNVETEALIQAIGVAT